MLTDSITIFVPNLYTMITILRVYEPPDATAVIEFSSKRIMANTCNVLLAVAFLASLSLSAGLVKGDLDIFKDYETHSNYEAPQYLREKRQENVDSHEKKHDAAFLEELSDSKTVDDRKTTEEDVKIAEQKSDVKNEEQKKANTSNEIEKDAQVIIDLFATAKLAVELYRCTDSSAAKCELTILVYKNSKNISVL